MGLTGNFHGTFTYMLHRSSKAEEENDERFHSTVWVALESAFSTFLRWKSGTSACLSVKGGPYKLQEGLQEGLQPN